MKIHLSIELEKDETLAEAIDRLYPRMQIASPAAFVRGFEAKIQSEIKAAEIHESEFGDVPPDPASVTFRHDSDTAPAEELEPKKRRARRKAEPVEPEPVPNEPEPEPTPELEIPIEARLREVAREYAAKAGGQALAELIQKEGVASISMLTPEGRARVWAGLAKANV
jgi:hypothetical protein